MSQWRFRQEQVDKLKKWKDAAVRIQSSKLLSNVKVLSRVEDILRYLTTARLGREFWSFKRKPPTNCWFQAILF